MIRHFDALEHNKGSFTVVRLADDDYGLYASGIGNAFGTPLAARGSRDEIRAEFRRVAPGAELPEALR
jgi:hypothetical protein